jgi:hypothetical protein
MVIKGSEAATASINVAPIGKLRCATRQEFTILDGAPRLIALA